MARRIVQPLPIFENPGEVMVGDPVTGDPTILSPGSVGYFLGFTAPGVLSWLPAASLFASDVTIQKNGPVRLDLYESDATTNEHRWRTQSSSGDWSVSAISDDGLTTSPGISLTRVGTTLTIAMPPLAGSGSRFVKADATGIISAVSAATARTDLGLVIGTNVQAWDADLDTLSSGITSFGQSLVNDASAFEARQTLGLGNSDASVFSLMEHFINNTINAVSVSSSGSGTWVKSADPGIGQTGVWDMATGGVSGDVIRIHLGPQNNDAMFSFVDNFDFTFLFSPSNIGSIEFFIGLIPTSAATTYAGGLDANRHIGLRYLAATDGGVFKFTYSPTGGPITVVATTVAPVATNWYKFRVRRIDASSIGIQINAQSEVILTTGFPTTGSYAPQCWLKATAASIRTVRHDAWYMYSSGMKLFT